MKLEEIEQNSKFVLDCDPLSTRMITNVKIKTCAFIDTGVKLCVSN